MQRRSLGFASVCLTDLALRVLALICPPTNFVPGLGFPGSVELLSLDLSTRNRRGGPVGNVTQSPLTPEPLRLYETHPLVLRTRSYLETLGLPGRDPSSLPDAGSRFADGGHYRIEIPTVNSLEAVLAVLDESEKRGVLIHRVTETLGFFRHAKSDVRAMVKACTDRGVELVMSPGPRAVYDTSATAQTSQGARIGYRLRGQEQLVRALVDVQRAMDCGVSAFVVYDEGMLMVLGNMRRDGLIPASTRFKVSAHGGHGNPAALQLLVQLGANSFNPVRDLSLAMIAGLRQAAPIPLDIHADNPPASGGFMRLYEVPEIVRVASPVYLKTGNSVLSGHGQLTTAEEARRMVRQAAVTAELLQEMAPDLRSSPLRHDGMDC